MVGDCEVVSGVVRSTIVGTVGPSISAVTHKVRKMGDVSSSAQRHLYDPQIERIKESITSTGSASSGIYFVVLPRTEGLA